ncbi:TPA: excisionase family protein [Enterobacter hormaechei]
MAQVIFNEEWMVEAKLIEKTGLSSGQIKSYRLKSWVNGVHFKYVTADGRTESEKGLAWYNYPKINHFIKVA